MMLKCLRYGLLVAMWTVALAGGAQSAVLLSEDFGGAGAPLDGTTTEVGGLTWQAGTAFHDDGTVDTIVAGGADGAAAFVPFAVQSGQYYIATAVITNTFSDWVAFGFMPALPPNGDWTQQDYTVRHSNSGAYAWALTRDQPSGNDQEGFGGPSTGNPAFAGDFADPQSPVTLRIELDTTGVTWTAEYFVNDVSQGLSSLPASASSDIGGIGFSRSWNASSGTSASIASMTVENLGDQTISGVIFANGTTPFQGATVMASNGGGSDTTDINGEYTIVVPHSWSGEVMPAATGYSMFPMARSYANVTSDLTIQDYDVCSDGNLDPCLVGLPFEGDVVHESLVSNDGWADNSINAPSYRQSSVTSKDGFQFVAFVDSQERVVLAKRALGTDAWTTSITQYSVDGLDAHNGVVIGIDGDGYLHVGWNHHDDPLHYARSTTPLGTTLTGQLGMVGSNESSVTYPQFFNLPDGRLLLMYRDGSSGDGDMVVNRYDPSTTSWTRLHTVLLDGEGQRNAYWQAAVDPTGRVHLSWVWRENPNVESNHDMGYARSDDGGVTWTRSDGSAYGIPITSASSEYAALIPQNSELINQTGMAGDADGNPYIVTYFREDPSNIPQYWLFHHDGTSWLKQQVSDRTTPFTLSGGGTQNIPIARPQVAVTHTYGPVVHMMFRDEERGFKVSLATSSDIYEGSWDIRDLTDYAVDQWEPTFDRALWMDQEELHIYVQRVVQIDDEGSAALAPTPVTVLERVPAATPVPGLVPGNPWTLMLVVSSFGAAALRMARRRG